MSKKRDRFHQRLSYHLMWTSEMECDIERFERFLEIEEAASSGSLGKTLTFCVQQIAEKREDPLKFK